MNTPLRSEIEEIIQAHAFNANQRGFMGESGAYQSDRKIADQILNLVASKMPEKKPKRSYAECCKDFRLMELALIESGFNQAIDSVQSILKGGTG